MPVPLCENRRWRIERWEPREEQKENVNESICSSEAKVNTKITNGE